MSKCLFKNHRIQQQAVKGHRPLFWLQVFVHKNPFGNQIGQEHKCQHEYRGAPGQKGEGLGWGQMERGQVAAQKRQAYSGDENSDHHDIAGLLGSKFIDKGCDQPAQK